MKNFKKWWNEVGSAIRPNEGDDFESHAERVAALAWKASKEIEVANTKRFLSEALNSGDGSYRP